MTTSTIAELSEHEFEQLANYVRQKIGLNLKPEKRALVQSRLIKRIRQLNLHSFQDYLELLQDRPTMDEMDALSQALTTNVTSFFRENHHFETLARIAKSNFRPRLDAGEEIRIWSAGCSTGAEPYSIAMTLRKALEPEVFSRVKILATDLDNSVLQTAKSAIYKQKDLEALPSEMKPFFRNTDTQNAQVSDEIRARVSFRPLNLIDPWPMQRQFHAIFCRNVMIYFDSHLQSELCKRFIDKMDTGGYLFIGHSERIEKEHLKSLKADGITTYQKIH